MKKLSLNFEGVTDTTGYLFSLAKCLSTAVRNSPWHDSADDIVATSGFAFRMWVNRDFCPSATSIWAFDMQEPWVGNGGFVCKHVGRYWKDDIIEEERRLAAIENIKESVDNGIAAVAWDISGYEWGLVVGYNDETQKLYTLKINGSEDEITYESLGQLNIKILSVLTVTGKTDKTTEKIMNDTVMLAVSHLNGEEWNENPKGLAAYPAFITSMKEKYNTELSWNLDYYLGTYGALKYYAWKYFDKYGKAELAEYYRDIHNAWQTAFEIKKSRDATESMVMNEIITEIEKAYVLETKACELMKEMTK